LSDASDAEREEDHDEEIPKRDADVAKDDGHDTNLLREVARRPYQG
jgi:hypothetical protein